MINNSIAIESAGSSDSASFEDLYSLNYNEIYRKSYSQMLGLKSLDISIIALINSAFEIFSKVKIDGVHEKSQFKPQKSRIDNIKDKQINNFNKKDISIASLYKNPLNVEMLSVVDEGDRNDFLKLLVRKAAEVANGLEDHNEFGFMINEIVENVYAN